MPFGQRLSQSSGCYNNARRALLYHRAVLPMLSNHWQHWLLAFIFVGAGAYHFINPAAYLRIMPGYLPYPLELIYISGFWEIIAGLAMLLPQLRPWSGYNLIVLLLAVFPANINMALQPQLVAGVPVWLLWLRLPLQFVLIWWVWRVN
jgi:uncharacterized membrane protein